MNLSVFKEEKMKKDIIPDFKLDFEFNALYVSLSKYIYKKSNSVCEACIFWMTSLDNYISHLGEL